MFSTALRQRWLALKDGVKIGERWLGYAADECRRITVLQQSASAIVRMTRDLRVERRMKHNQAAV
jgi:hypothetical protein